MISTLSALLKRPLPGESAPAPARSPGKAKSAEPDAAPESSQPVTQAEILSALQDVFEQRQAAEITVEELAFRREELIADDSASVGGVTKLEDEARAASATVLRCDALTDKLLKRLRDARHAEQRVAFAEAQAAALAHARSLLPIFEQAAAASQAWRETQERIALLFPGAAKHLPGLISVTQTDVALFAETIASFATVYYGAPSPATQPQTVADAAARVIAGDAALPDWGYATGFAQDIIAETQRPRTIVLTRSSLDAAGKRVRAGEEITLPAIEAAAMVRQSIARWKESTI